MSVGPGEVQAAADAAVAALSVVLSPSLVVGSRAQWASAVGSLQQVLDVAAAAQNAAIVRLAAIEPEWCEDGTVVETHRAPGHVALDAPAVLSGVLSSSALHAERRVEAAVLLAADGPDGPDGMASGSGLGGLHVAMGQGRLDPYRASVVAQELEAAPAQVRATVVTVLEPYLDVEDGAHLRRRCRRALARISPELLLERAKRARAGCGLRRWVAEPGVDRWEGTFPCEDAASAWAAIDALAHRYVKDGVCTHIEAARGKALTDLVAGQATIDTVLTVTVPATGLLGEPGGHREAGTSSSEVVAVGPGSDDLVEVTGPAGNQPVFVSRAWVTAMATPNARPSSPAEAKDRTATSTPTPAPPCESGSTRGPGPGSQVVEVAPCHPKTGALIDPQHVRPDPADPAGRAAREGASTLNRIAAGFGAGAYRPSARMAKRVKARDRRCRFPGCTVAAVFCDLDHVRPWPTGPTADTNLICLCRRHHRVKQRPGWAVALAADGTLTWTDPTGRVRTTTPADALTCTVLGGAATPPPAPASTSITLTALPDGPHSDLEFRVEHHLAAARPTVGGRSIHRHRMATSWRDDNGTRHGAELTPTTNVIVFDVTSTPCRRPRQGGRHAFPDEPPF